MPGWWPPAGGEALVPPDAAEHGYIAVAHRDAPRHAGVEVVIHADGELGVLLGGTHDGAGLGGVAVPGVVDAVWVADGLDFSVSEIRQLPAGPAGDTGGWERENARDSGRMKRADSRESRTLSAKGKRCFLFQH